MPSSSVSRLDVSMAPSSSRLGTVKRQIRSAIATSAGVGSRRSIHHVLDTSIGAVPVWRPGYVVSISLYPCEPEQHCGVWPDA